MLTTSLGADPKAPSDDSSFAGSVVVTLLPLVVLGLMVVPFVRYLRRSQQRAEDYMKVSRETLAEVRKIRELLEQKRG